MANNTKNPLSNELEDFLSQFSEGPQTLTLELRDLVLELAPDAIEQIDQPARLLAYGYAQTYTHTICVIIPQKSYVNLGFPRGVELPDPSGLLEGTGKKARHVKIREFKQIRDPELIELLQDSIESTPNE